MSCMTGADFAAKGNLEVNAEFSKYNWRANRYGEVTRKCETCGAEFEPNSRTQKYCSKECRPSKEMRAELRMGVAKEPTEAERELLDFVKGYIDEKGHAPSYREIGDMMGISLNCVNYRLARLREKGFVTWRKRCARTLEVIR